MLNSIELSGGALNGKSLTEIVFGSNTIWQSGNFRDSENNTFVTKDNLVFNVKE